MVRPGQFLQTPPDRTRRHAGCHRHRGNAAITRSKRLRRRDQTTAPFVEKRRYRGKPLPDGFNIDHHHNIWCEVWVVNSYITLSKVDSLISGQALSSVRPRFVLISAIAAPPVRYSRYSEYDVALGRLGIDFELATVGQTKALWRRGHD